MNTFGLTRHQYRCLQRLHTPAKIQDFIEAIPFNFEPNGDTVMSPRRVLAAHRAHCLEGALLAALALRLHGHRPRVVDLRVDHRTDYDHVIAVFQERGRWGAISKTNHAVLRYRDPVYASIRELVMSYFHEYAAFGKKTLRAFSRPVDLSRFDRRGWMTDENDLWYIHEYLDAVPHTNILRPQQARTLRRLDPIERKAGDAVVWKKER